MFAYRLVQVPDFSLFYADAGLEPVKKQAATSTGKSVASTGASSCPAPPGASAGVIKLNATQHRKRQRQHQKQKAADAAAADLPPAFDPTVTRSDSQSQATKQTGPKPHAAAGTSATSPKLPTSPSSPRQTSSSPPPTNPLALTTPPSPPSTSSPPATADPEASTSPPSSSKDSESPQSTVGPVAPFTTSSTTGPPPKPAARNAKPGSAQHKKQAEQEAMLSQQVAAAQTESAFSVADLKPATDQAKPQKPADVPAGNQPQTVTAFQPKSMAVQSSGVDTQPPLASVETTTATEVVSSPGAILPISWLQQHLSCVLLYHCLPCATGCVCV